MELFLEIIFHYEVVPASEVTDEGKQCLMDLSYIYNLKLVQLPCVLR